MFRREFLAAAAATLPLAGGRPVFGRSRVSAITDEVGTTPQEAIAFAKQYGLRWLELRRIPGAKVNYDQAPEEAVKAAAEQFREAGLSISFLNTGLLKFALPGTAYIRQKEETAAAREHRLETEKRKFDSRMEDLRRAIRAAHLLGVDKIRIFAFLRVAEREKLLPQVTDIIGEMAHIAEREKIRLLVENESSCNVATSQEAADFVKPLPAKSVGVNWDPHNDLYHKQTPFPDGYALLPKKRLWNVQIKGKSLLEPGETLDWAGIFGALIRDGYKGHAGLETHYFDGTLIEKANRSMAEIVRLAEPS